MTSETKGTNRRGRERRVKLIETALHAFAFRGFRGVSLATIADEAGISEPGLIHHFPTKADLLLAVIAHYEAETGEHLRTAMENSDGSFASALLATAARHEQDPTFIRLFTVLVAESVNPEHPTHEWAVTRYEHVRRSIADGVKDDQENGRFRSDLDPELAARQIIAMFDGIQLQYLLAGGELDLVSPLRALLDSYR